MVLGLGLQSVLIVVITGSVMIGICVAVSGRPVGVIVEDTHVGPDGSTHDVKKYSLVPYTGSGPPFIAGAVQPEDPSDGSPPR